MSSSHTVSLSTRDLDDDLELSTASEPTGGPAPAYADAMDALEALMRYVEPGAFDPEAISVRGGGPMRSDDLIPDRFRGAKLLAAFQRAESRASESDWRVWVAIRINSTVARELDVSKGEVYRAMKRVKRLIEEELHEAGLLFRNVVRDADAQEFPEWVDVVKKETG